MARLDLHVLVVTRAIAPLHGVGGLETSVHDLVRHLLRRGARVTLVTRPPAVQDSSGEIFADDRLAVQFVPYRSFPLSGIRGTIVLDRSTAYPLFGWRAGRMAARLVREGGVHLVHGMGAASLGYARARAGDRLGTVPFFFNPHGMEEFGSTGPPLGAIKGAGYAPLRAAVRACAHAADRVIATDRVLVATVVKHLEVPEADVSVIPNAVDLEAVDRLADPAAAAAVRARLGLAADEVLLVGVGRLEQNKGFQSLIAALAKLAAAGSTPSAVRWRCVLLGEGSFRARLEADIRAAGLGDVVQLAGRVTDADLHAWYGAATLFVHPSLYEGSSIVTLEAMAHHLPIVGTTAGGLPDKIRPGINGWMVAPGDASALGRALQDALMLKRDALRAMGEQSRAIVEREFAWTVVVDQLMVLYEDVLTGRLQKRDQGTVRN